MSTYHKILLGLIAAAYLISPVDIIPDFLIPYIGWFDDTFIIGLIIYYLRRGKLPDLFYKKRKGGFGSRPWYFRDNTHASSQGSASSNGSQFSKVYSRGKKSSSSDTNSTSGPQQDSSRGESQGATQQHREKNEEKQRKKQSPHEILGISPGASREEIMAAYRRGVKQYHPDRVDHLGKEFKELANRKFIEIKDAYNTLMKSF